MLVRGHKFEEDFLSLGLSYVRKAPRLSSSGSFKRFRELYGVPPKICSTLWALLDGKHPKGGKP